MGQTLDDTPPEQPIVVTALDRPGLRRDTAYFLGYQFLAVGTISLWPQSQSNYSSKIGIENWWHNVTHPQWDTDGVFVNFVLHPYWGAGYYIRARERGLKRGQAFWYSAMLSSIFEFGAEAMVERVSIQDLVITPVLGSLLGDYVFLPLREHIRAKEEPLGTLDQAALVLTDPLGSINAAVDRMFGVETQISLRPMLSGAGPGQRFPAEGAAHPPYPNRVGWGLQLRIVW